MWGLLPLQPLTPQPRNPVAAVQQPPNHHPTAVRCLQDISSRRESASASQPNEQNRQNTETSTTRTPPPPPQQQNQEPEEPPKQMPLSGSAILMALQRASAQKSKSKSKKATRNASNKSGRDVKGIRDFSHVKPFNIKADWSDRLAEIENRLQELLDD